MARKKVNKLIEDNTNYILEYWNAIQNKEIIVCKKIYKLYERLAYESQNEIRDRWIFDVKKASYAIRFIEKFMYCGKGKFSRKQMKLILFQKAFISTIFGFVDKDTGFRRYKDVLLVMSRKNGKTGLSAAISQLLLTEEYGGEIYCGANTASQASLLFNDVMTSIRLCDSFSSNGKKRKTDYIFYPTQSTIKYVSGETSNLDGLNASCAIIDEIHEMKSNENSMYQILKQSMSMREQPLLIMITTQGFVRDGMLDEFYELAKDVIYNQDSQNERFIAFVYEQDSKEEINDESMWVKSNPSIDVIKSREDLREKVAMAKTNSSLMASLLVKDFDIVQNGSQLFLTWEEVNIDDKDLLVHKLSTNLYDTYCTLGFDLSASGTDASAATINIKKDGKYHILTKMWIPASRYEVWKDNFKLPVDKWIEAGYLALSGDTQVNYEDMLSWFLDTCDRYKLSPVSCHFDRYQSQFLIKELEDRGINMVPTPMTTKVLSPLCFQCKALLQSKKIVYYNPVLKWMLLNVEVKTDTHANVFPVKGDMKSKNKIDGFISLLCSLDAQNDPTYNSLLENN